MTASGDRTYIRLVLSFFLFSFTATAQEKDSASVVAAEISEQDSTKPYYYRINGTYLKTYWEDFKYIASSPARWKGREWGKFAIVTGTAGLFMLVADREVHEMMQRNQNETFKSVSKVAYPLGNRLPPLLLSGMYVTSVITKNRRMEHATLSIAKSLAISTVFYTAGKSVIRRQRPTRTDDPYDFVPPFTNKGYTSFPSGHANTAFATATAFALEYKDKKWVPWVAYTLASLTAVSRLYDNRHWASDVLIGSAIGHFVTKGVYKMEEKRIEKRRLKHPNGL